MKAKGEIGAKITEDMTVESKIKDTLWFKGINVANVPYIQRPKNGGLRYNFFGYSNLNDMALEIKESDKRNFQHTGDVHRNAHYIGMYILREMYVGNPQHQELDAMDQYLAPMFLKAQKRQAYRSQFTKTYDLFVDNTIDEGIFHSIIEGMLDKLDGDTETKEWLLNDIEKILQDQDMYGRTKNKVYMRQYRAKQAGLEVIRNVGA